MRISKYYFLVVSIISVLLLQNCRLSPPEGFEWDADLLAPIAFSSTGITQLIQDTTYLKTGSDNLLSLVVRDTVASIALNDFIEFPDTTVRLGVKLDTLALASDTISQQLTLADLARQLIATGEIGNIITGTLILGSHGDTLAGLPATPGLSSGTIDIDASNFFEFAELEEGNLILSINNQFPLDITNVVIEVKNQTTPGDPLVRDTFPLIPAGTLVSESYDLSGKTVESQLVGELINLDVSAGTDVPIDTSDFIEVILVAEDLKAKTAKAVFPAQDVIDSSRTTVYTFPGEFADIELTKLLVKSGKIQASTISTVEDTIRFRYAITSALNAMGEVPAVDLKLNPAPPGGISTQVVERELGGFVIDMTDGGTTFNTIREKITVSLVESGNLVTLDNTDSVAVEFGLVEIEPTYIEGYIGQEKFTFSGQRAIDLFETLDVKKLKFADPRANIIFASSLGVKADVTVKDFTAVNSNTGQRTPLSGTPLVSGPVRILGPELPDTTGTALTTIAFNRDNSNIPTFINLLANEISYDIEVLTNPGVKTILHDNFATENSQLAAYVDFELPLEGIVEELKLGDTTNLAFGEVDFDQIQGATLRIIIENQFPFAANVNASILDENKDIVAILSENQTLEPGVVGSTGFVDMPGESILEKEFTLAEMEEIVNTGKSLALRYSLDTKPNGTPVKLFADYQIKAKLVGEFIYRVTSN